MNIELSDHKEGEIRKLLYTYVDSVKRFNIGRSDFSEIEICKIAIADLIISQLLIDAPKLGNSPPKTRRGRFGYIYLMKNLRNGMIKIGWSTDPCFREQTLQSEEPEVELFFFAAGHIDLEASLHNRFATKRKRGEWFQLTDEDIAYVGKMVGGCL